MPAPPPYRDFYYPLNVFMHILTHEEGDVPYLHYALFQSEDEKLATAQERSTQLLIERLPRPPARLLEVGIGLGTTLARLSAIGYAITGITPDEKQIAVARARHGDGLNVECVRFEDFTSDQPFDTVFFQESSQYIEANALFAKAASLTTKVIVVDEFATKPLDFAGALHQFDDFLAAAQSNGFRKREQLELSTMAAPTIDYFLVRFPKYRESLIAELGITREQVVELIDSGLKYRELYRQGAYVYRLLVFQR